MFEQKTVTEIDTLFVHSMCAILQSSTMLSVKYNFEQSTVNQSNTM